MIPSASIHGEAVDAVAVRCRCQAGMSVDMQGWQKVGGSSTNVRIEQSQSDRVGSSESGRARGRKNGQSSRVGNGQMDKYQVYGGSRVNQTDGSVPRVWLKQG